MNLARKRLANPKTGGTVLDTPKNKRKIAALRSAYPNVKRKKTKNPKTGRMVFDTVANWKKKAAWAKQQVKQYIALRAIQRKIRGRLAARQFGYMGNFSPHGNIGVYAYRIDPNGAYAVYQACRHVWQRFRQTARVTLEYYIPHGQGGGWHAGHHMTILGQTPLVDSMLAAALGVPSPSEPHEQKNVPVDNLSDLLAIGSGFEADRLNLSEKYEAGEKLYEDSVYKQVTKIRFRVYIPTTNTAVGDRQTYLMKEHILQNESEPGYCLATAIRSNWSNGTPNFSGITDQLFTEMTGFGAEGVQISQLSHVESTVQVTTRKGKIYKPQFVVFDLRFQTARLPEWTPRNKHQKHLCYLVQG